MHVVNKADMTWRNQRSRQCRHYALHLTKSNIRQSLFTKLFPDVSTNVFIDVIRHRCHKYTQQYCRHTLDSGLLMVPRGTSGSRRCTVGNQGMWRDKVADHLNRIVHLSWSTLIDCTKY